MKIKFKRFMYGIKRIMNQNILLVLPLIYIIAICYLTDWSKTYISSNVLRYVLYAIMLIIAISGVLFIIMLIGTPLRARLINKKLTQVGFIDNLGNSPILLSWHRDKNSVSILFYSQFISLLDYENRKEDIETVLNLKIISISRGKDMQHVVIKAVKSSRNKNSIIYWNDTYINQNDFVLILGESDNGYESIDISRTPHVLIGGGTGSGKTILLKLMLMQSIKKGAKIYLADFKGGIDYLNTWHSCCKIIINQEEFEQDLSNIILLMNERRTLLLESKTSNISDYNNATGNNLPRIIVACDEIAEVLDKTGLNKDEKELVSKIESKLSTIARQGRAFGIHLIFATQRPDADVLKGQIKNNIGYRICGRADKVLSQIILDNPVGAEMITPDDQGMFYTNFNVLFKAFYVDDSDLIGGIEGNYEKN